MKFKKLLSTALIMALTVSAISGCGAKPAAEKAPDKATEATETKKDAEPKKEDAPKESSENAAPAASTIAFPLKEPVTMSMFAIMNNDVELPSVKAFKKMEELTGVKWEVQSVLGADLLEKRNLLLSSNQYPDVFCKAGLSMADLSKYGGQKTFIPLNDLIQKNAPNLAKLLVERAGVEQQITSGDGNIYSLPEISFAIPGGNTIYFMNQKWLENVGMTEPKNLDELYNVLKAFKEKDPNKNGKADEIPFVATNNLVYLLPYFGVSIDPGSNTVIENDALTYVPTSEKYKEFLQYLTKLYSEGLLEKNSFTNTYEQQVALGNQGDILGTFFNGGAFQSVGYERCFDFKELTPFAKGVYPTTTGAVPGTFVITDTCKTPDIAMAWADKWYDEAGGILAWMGVEGESFKMKDGGNAWEWILGDYENVVDMRQNESFQGAANHPSVQPELWSKGDSDPSETQLSQQRKRLIDDGAKPFPTLNFSDADTKTISSAKADIDPYVAQFMAQVVTGEIKLDEGWDTYVQTLGNMGLSQMMELYNKAFAATK